MRLATDRLRAGWILGRAFVAGCGARGSLLGETSGAGAGGEGAGGASVSGPSGSGGGSTVGQGGGGGAVECLADGLACESDRECCSGLCPDGRCLEQKCLPSLAPCTSPEQCCEGICDNGICGVVECLPDGVQCMTDGACCAGVCDAGVCGRTTVCFENGTGCLNPEECCEGICEGGFCGKATCTHDECIPGDPLSPACNPCAAAVCANDPFCCSGAWDDLCVSAAGSICGTCPTTCTTDGGACMTGGDCCSGSCANGVCSAGPLVCAHDECEAGGPLDAVACGGCVKSVCAADPFCCQSGWDQLCIDAAVASCGIDCGTGCTPAGGMCANNEQCCTGSCKSGVCTEACGADGDSCMNSSDCCSGACVAGTCGTVACPSDGSACGDCVATECCGQLTSCVTNPACAQDLGAFVFCATGGNDPITCFLENVDDPRAFEAAGCFLQNCASSCF